MPPLLVIKDKSLCWVWMKTSSPSHCLCRPGWHWEWDEQSSLSSLNRCPLAALSAEHTSTNYTSAYTPSFRGIDSDTTKMHKQYSVVREFPSERCCYKNRSSSQRGRAVPAGGCPAEEHRSSLQHTHMQGSKCQRKDICCAKLTRKIMLSKKATEIQHTIIQQRQTHKKLRLLNFY